MAIPQNVKARKPPTVPVPLDLLQFLIEAAEDLGAPSKELREAIEKAQKLCDIYKKIGGR